MFSREFWTSNANHVAVNPHHCADSAGLENFAAGQGMERMCFFQTSGSEGRPKWVALPKEAFLISGQVVNEHFKVIAADRWLIALPAHHVGGFAIHARAHLSGSGLVEDHSRWQPDAFVETCNREGITLVSLVPTQMHDLVRNRLHAPPDLRVAIIGGGAMSMELAAAAKAQGWPVFQTYGMTEAASQIATQSYAGRDLASDDLELDVLPHWQVRTDSDGRLVLRGASLANGYAFHSEKGIWSWQPIGDELVTRDIVSLRTCGRGRLLSFVGRESGFIKILGELIHLAPLQARMDSLSLVHGLAPPPVIVSVPEPRMGSRLLLVTECKAGAALLEPFNAVTEPLCQLSEVIQIPGIPRTSLGKVDATALQTCLSGMISAVIK
jgi:O-succinylbenzoic acid--CoA ligase